MPDEQSVLGPEAREILSLLLPTGTNLREFITSCHARLNPGAICPSPWNLLEYTELPPEATTPAGKIIEQIQRWGRDAREGDLQAGILLALVALEGALQLKSTTPRNPALAEFATKMPLWAVVWSPISTFRTTRRQINALQIGMHMGQLQGSKLGVDALPSFLAAAVACYMYAVKIGHCHPTEAKWAKEVRDLPDLTQKTAQHWWPLALKEINRSYPDIVEYLFGHIKPELRKPKNEAIRVVRQPFKEAIWKMFDNSETAPNESHAQSDLHGGPEADLLRRRKNKAGLRKAPHRRHPSGQTNRT